MDVCVLKYPSMDVCVLIYPSTLLLYIVELRNPQGVAATCHSFSYCLYFLQGETAPFILSPS